MGSLSEGLALTLCAGERSLLALLSSRCHRKGKPLLAASGITRNKERTALSVSTAFFRFSVLGWDLGTGWLMSQEILLCIREVLDIGCGTLGKEKEGSET